MFNYDPKGKQTDKTSPDIILAVKP